MIAIKVVLFFFAFICSFLCVEDFIEKIIGHLKKSEEEYHELYIRGLIETLSFWPTLLTVLFWTGFYFVNQL